MNYINHNIFFIIEDYYIYLNDNNKEYIYHPELIDNILYLFIKNKYKKDNIKIKIIYKNSYYTNIYNTFDNIINIRSSLNNWNIYAVVRGNCRLIERIHCLLYVGDLSNSLKRLEGYYLICIINKR